MAGLTKTETAVLAVKYDLKDLKPGEQLLGTKVACFRYGVSALLVNIAYQKLESEGLVEIIPGYGTFKL